MGTKGRGAVLRGRIGRGRGAALPSARGLPGPHSLQLLCPFCFALTSSLPSMFGAYTNTIPETRIAFDVGAYPNTIPETRIYQTSRADGVAFIYPLLYDTSNSRGYVIRLYSRCRVAASIQRQRCQRRFKWRRRWSVGRGPRG
jgi:hypothetical protein